MNNLMHEIPNKLQNISWTKYFRTVEKFPTFVNSSSSSNKSKLGLQSSGMLLEDKYRHLPTCMVSNHAISDIRTLKRVTQLDIFTVFKKARIIFLARMKVCKLNMAEKKWQWGCHAAADQV